MMRESPNGYFQIKHILYIEVAGEVIEATEQHVFYIDNVGWIPASMIEEGDVVVLQSGDKSTVEKIDKVVHNELITVYNFEVEDFHTYFVSDASVLVHNNGCKSTSSKKTKSNGVGNPIKTAGRGSTGRTAPNTLIEQMAMYEVQSNPLKGAKDLSSKFKLGDGRWNHKDGWIKMARNVKGVEIHFVYNKKTGMFDDFKYAIN